MNVCLLSGRELSYNHVEFLNGPRIISPDIVPTNSYYICQELRPDF